ncbi:MAG TPA: hypothetical protein VK364_08590, partial [Hymenobacter sp.]|nr:hypothetical protein [Hymenobacter sp.]
MQTNPVLTVFVSLALTTASVQAQPRSATKAPPRPKAPTVAPTRTGTVNNLPEFALSRAEVESHTRFLASDELQGRRTGELGNQIAARYIAEQFRLLGLKPAASTDGQAGYFQPIAMERVKASSSAIMIVGKDTLRLGKELAVMTGGPADVSGEVLYAGYGLTDGDDGYKGRSVKGRIVVVQGGSPEAKGPGEIFKAS